MDRLTACRYFVSSRACLMFFPIVRKFLTFEYLLSRLCSYVRQSWASRSSSLYDCIDSLQFEKISDCSLWGIGGKVHKKRRLVICKFTFTAWKFSFTLKKAFCELTWRCIGDYCDCKSLFRLLRYSGIGFRKDGLFFQGHHHAWP